MNFGLEQEGGSLMAPMGLAHPLHPIDNRSRNKRRNLWVGRCVSSWWPWFPSRSSVLIYMYIYICMYIPYTSSVIGRIYNGSVIQYWQSCTPSRSIGLFLGGVWFLGWMPLFVFFGLPIVSCSLIKNLILGCLWPLVFGMSNLQPNCCLKFDFQKVDQHAGGNCLIHDTNRCKDNQLQRTISWQPLPHPIN